MKKNGQRPNLKWMSAKIYNPKSNSNGPYKKKYERSAFDASYGAVIHRSQFRRLADKTQVYTRRKTDYLRTRLTHSIEVAQIGRQLARVFAKELKIKEYLNNKVERDNFKKDFEELVATACLAHDIGHPPFGHAGEKILDKKMEQSGGFCGNKQNVRLLMGSEARLPFGVTYSVIDAIMKYKNKDKPPVYEEEKHAAKIIWDETGCDEKTRHPACYLMEAADDIAYITSDIEDAIKMGLLKKNELLKRVEKFLFLEDDYIEYNPQERNAEWEKLINDNFKDNVFKISDKLIKFFILHTINVIKSLELGKMVEANKDFPVELQKEIDKISNCKEPGNLLYCKDPHAKECLHNDISEFKKWIYGEKILKSKPVVEDNNLGQNVINKLFEHLVKNCTRISKLKIKEMKKDNFFMLFPSHVQEKIKSIKPATHDADRSKEIDRYVCDYISGMTSSYAISFLEKISSEKVSF